MLGEEKHSWRITLAAAYDIDVPIGAALVYR
jgi:hypothetical protein